MFFSSPTNKDLDKMATILAKSVEKMFLDRNSVHFSQDPVIARKLIIEYGGLMRSDGMEKYNEPTFISYINYYLNAKDMESKKAIGAIVVYIEQSFVATLLKLLRYPLADDEDLDALADCCGTLCNIIAGAFKTDISKEGYLELEMSHFTSYRNRAVVGVPFHFAEREKMELTFFIQNQKRLMIDLTIGTLPKR